MIEITVKGEPGVGKSSVATLIADKLMDAGFDKIEVNMLDAVNDENEWFSRNDLRIANVKDTPVRIVEKLGRVREMTDE